MRGNGLYTHFGAFLSAVTVMPLVMADNRAEALPGPLWLKFKEAFITSLHIGKDSMHLLLCQRGKITLDMHFMLC